MEKVMCGCRLLLKYAATKEAEIDVSGIPLRGGPPINSVPFHKELGSPCSPLGEKVVPKFTVEGRSQPQGGTWKLPDLLAP